MHDSVMAFVSSVLRSGDVQNKRVLECGSYDVNGSVRKLFDGAWSYTGIDINEGPGVDTVLAAEDAAEYFGPGAFDIVVSTEMLEHCKHWREAITAMKQVLRPGGLLILTTRSEGFVHHNEPDYWRWSVEQLVEAFSDFLPLSAESDPQTPGVFIAARKPLAVEAWAPAPLGHIEPSTVSEGIPT